MTHLAKRIYWTWRKSEDPLSQLAHVVHIGCSLAYHYGYLRLKKLVNPHRQIVALSLVEHLGDIVASEPISRYLRKAYPDAYILWIVCKPYREVVETNPALDRALVVACLTEWHFLKRCGAIDRVVDLHILNHRCRICRFSLPASEIDSQINFQNFRSFGSLLSVRCQCAGLPTIADAPRLPVPEASADLARRFKLPGEYLTIHRSSNFPAKEWEPEKWRDLIAGLLQRDAVNIVELGIEAPSHKPLSANYVDLCGRTSLVEMAAVIRSSKCFIGIDSGPAHLANAVGTYGIILLGSHRNFGRWVPFSGAYADGTNAALIFADGPVKEIGLDRVLQAFDEFWHRRRRGRLTV